MASATMGLRRRVPVNGSPTPSGHSPPSSSSTSSPSSGASSGTSSKRSRSENNNSPSHGNLNSTGSSSGQQGRDEPPTKKSRGTSTTGSKSSTSTSTTTSSTSSSLSSSSNATNTGGFATTTDASQYHHSTKSRATSISRSSSSQQTKTASSSSTSTSTSTSNPSSISTSDASTTSSNVGTPSVAASSTSTTSIAGSTNALSSATWPTASGISEVVPSYASVTGMGMTGAQGAATLCSGSLGMSTAIPYMSASMATFVGNATNLGKSSSVSYLDISNMTGGSLSSTATNALQAGYGTGGGAGGAGAGGNASAGNGKTVTAASAGTTTGTGSGLESGKSGSQMSYYGISSSIGGGAGGGSGGGGSGGGGGGGAACYGLQSNGQGQSNDGNSVIGLPKKFQSDGMFNAYQPWVIKTYGDLAKTKTITIKKYARILRTLRGEEVNSAENSKFRFWVKSKGFHIGQPEGYDAKPADRIIGRHAVTSAGLDPPLYVPTQPPHNKTLNGAEGTVPPGRVYKKVAIVENFFDIIHAVHVDLEGRPGKHAGQKRTYRTITETYAFLPREAVTRFLLGCTECQRRPRTPSPTNLSNQSQSTSTTSAGTSTTTHPSSTSTGSTSSSSTPLSPTSTLSSSPMHSSPKVRDGSNHRVSEGSNGNGKGLYSYRHQKHHKATASASTSTSVASKHEKHEKEEKYNPLSITNLLKKEPSLGGAGGNGGFLSSSENLTESRRTPESDRASSRSSASSKRKRMLPEGRTPSPQPTQPLPRPWSPGLDPKDTPIDYSLPITTSYLKHQQRLLQAEKNKAESCNGGGEAGVGGKETVEFSNVDVQHGCGILRPRSNTSEIDGEVAERERFSPAAGLIDTNLNLLATIQHLHCQVMLALTERLRPTIAMPGPLVLPLATANVLSNRMLISTEVSVQTGENQS